MIGNVIAPFDGVYIEPFDPDSVFDPTTHIATETNYYFDSVYLAPLMRVH